MRSLLAHHVVERLAEEVDVDAFDPEQVLSGGDAGGVDGQVRYVRKDLRQ